MQSLASPFTVVVLTLAVSRPTLADSVDVRLGAIGGVVPSRAGIAGGAGASIDLGEHIAIDGLLAAYWMRSEDALAWGDFTRAEDVSALAARLMVGPRLAGSSGSLDVHAAVLVGVEVRSVRFRTGPAELGIPTGPLDGSENDVAAVLALEPSVSALYEVGGWHVGGQLSMLAPLVGHELQTDSSYPTDIGDDTRSADISVVAVLAIPL